MGKIKGWKKISDGYKHIHWHNKVDHWHHHSIMLNKIDNAWVIDVSHNVNGRESNLRLFKSDLVSRQEAIRQATQYMRGHPNG